MSTKIATLTITEDGAPAPTADTYILSNDAGTIAIDRVSDGAIVLAPSDADAVVSPSTGVYTYDYTDLNLDPGESYRVHFKTQTSPSPAAYDVEIIQAADASRTLRGYCRDLLKTGLLGRYGRFTTTEASSSTTDTRELISSQLVDKDAEPELIATRYEAAFIYIATGAELGSQRRVTTSNGYVPSAGKLLVNNDFGTVIASGIDFEILRRLPRVDDPVSGLTGIRTIINEALSYCFRVRRLEFTCTEANMLHYAIDDWPWLTREDQIGPVYDPLTEANLNPSRHQGGCWLRYNVDLPMIELEQPFNVDDVFQIDVAQPANTYIKSDGAWGDSTVGLVSDDDEALVEATIVRAVALGLAFRTLAGITEGQESADWSQKEQLQLAKAALLKGVFRQRLLPSARETFNAFTSKGQGGGQTTVNSSRIRRSGRGGIVTRRWY